MKCSKCGSELNNCDVCPNCGSINFGVDEHVEPVSASKCSTCGKILDPTWKYCPNCNNLVNDTKTTHNPKPYITLYIIFICISIISYILMYVYNISLAMLAVMLSNIVAFIISIIGRIRCSKSQSMRRLFSLSVILFLIFFIYVLLPIITALLMFFFIIASCSGMAG